MEGRGQVNPRSGPPPTEESEWGWAVTGLADSPAGLAAWLQGEEGGYANTSLPTRWGAGSAGSRLP